MMKLKMKKMLVFLLLWLYLINHLHAAPFRSIFKKIPIDTVIDFLTKIYDKVTEDHNFDWDHQDAPQGNYGAWGENLYPTYPAPEAPEAYPGYDGAWDEENRIASPSPPPPPEDAPAPEAPEAYPVFKSILCGASGNFTDNNNIIWTGDEDLISNGSPHTLKSDDPVYNTLRAFNNTRKKNCYSIKAIEGGKVLVRVVFNYGNYDGKESPPMFDLHFDGNFWITVNSSEATYYEAIYVVKRKFISVCVARIDPKQVPFISSIEVRSIDSKAYNRISLDYALLTNYRIGYGLNDITRYRDDPYDRLWFPIDGYTGLEVVSNEEYVTKFTTSDNPPVTVLGRAIQTPNISIPGINLKFGTLVYPFSYPVYINWYFTEVTELTETDLRSFRIYKDAEPFSFPIEPRFGNVSENTASNIYMSYHTNFSIVASEHSTLPPLINAIEIFSISGALTNGTNDNDVEGLDSLKKAFDVLKDWHGDPCLPANYSWDWIECNNNMRPRVISLNLNGYNLSGPLPDFSSMDALEIIDLHDNSLTGPVPVFLGNMSNLKQLNLAENQFSGSIPRSLSGNSQLNLTYTGNLLAMSDSDKKKIGKSSMILTITIPLFFIF